MEQSKRLYTTPDGSPLSELGAPARPSEGGRTMPARQSQQHLAAASSARARRTDRIIRLLADSRPLTSSQRAAIIAAAADIQVVDA